MRRKRIFLALLGAVGLGLLALFNYFAPIQLPSLSVWTGIVSALVGIICLVKPARRPGAVMLVTGVALAAAGLLWPAPLLRVENARSKLDEIMPEYHYYEKHTLRVQAPPERVAEAIEQTTFDDIKVYYALMHVRAMAAGARIQRSKAPPQPILKVMRHPSSGFIPLHQDSREIVMGMVGQPWSSGRRPGVQDLAGFRSFNELGSVRIAFNLRITDDGGGWSTITTETRILALDDAARRTMGRYWRVIYPGTGMIRRMWLNAIGTKLVGSVA